MVDQPYWEIRHCFGCGNVVPVTVPNVRLYCSALCRTAERRRAKRKRDAKWFAAKYKTDTEFRQRHLATQKRYRDRKKRLKLSANMPISTVETETGYNYSTKGDTNEN